MRWYLKKFYDNLIKVIKKDNNLIEHVIKKYL